MSKRVARFNAQEAEEALAIMKRFDAIVERTDENKIAHVMPVLTKLIEQYFDFTGSRMTRDEIQVCVRILFRRAKSERNMTLEKISKSERGPVARSAPAGDHARARAGLRVIDGGRKDPKPMVLRGEFKL